MKKIDIKTKFALLASISLVSFGMIFQDQIFAEENKIPTWIKNNAKWWSDGQLDDATFIQGIQYLINNGILKVGDSNKHESLPTYVSTSYGFQIQYPKNWIVSENVMGSVVAFASNKSVSGFSDNINIGIEDLSQNPLSLKEYSDYGIQLLQKIITDIEITDSKIIKIDTNDAYQITFTGKQGTYDLTWIQYYTIKDNNAYIITFTSLTDNFIKSQNTIQQIIPSFRLHNSQESMLLIDGVIFD